MNTIRERLWIIVKEIPASILDSVVYPSKIILFNVFSFLSCFKLSLKTISEVLIVNYLITERFIR